MGWKVPWPILMWVGEKVAGGVVAVWARMIGRGQSVLSDRGPGGTGNGTREELVAMMSMPVLSRPKKKSRPVELRAGMIALPIGTLPAGNILRKMGGLGTVPADRGVTGELSQVL